MKNTIGFQQRIQELAIDGPGSSDISGEFTSTSLEPQAPSRSGEKS